MLLAAEHLAARPHANVARLITGAVTRRLHTVHQNASFRGVSKRRGACPQAVAHAEAQVNLEFTRSSPETPHEGDLLNTILDMWPSMAAQHGDRIAIQEPHRAEAKDMTYNQVNQVINQTAAGLAKAGLVKGDTVGLFAEASSRWTPADQGAMKAGGVLAVRGSTAPAEEQAYIARHANCAALIFQDLGAMNAVMPLLAGRQSRQDFKFILLLWGPKTKGGEGVPAAGSTPIFTWDELIAQGQQALSNKWQPPHVLPEDLATYVYTSGTTGYPRGVMLTHANLVYQVNNLSTCVTLQPGDVYLSILPPWHIYQRTCTYFIHSCAGQMVVTTLRKFRDDLTSTPPDHLVCVPLVLDTLYNRVMLRLASASSLRRHLASFFIAVSSVFVQAQRVVKGVALEYALAPASWITLLKAMIVAALLRPLHLLGTKLVYSKVREALGIQRTVISGGGSLAAHLDTFFEVLGLPVLNGWGLSETSPVLACRQVEQGNVRGTVGRPLPGTRLRVVDPTTLEPLPDGQQGLLLAQGPGIMKGYLEDPGATANAFRAGDGWFDTGDLGWIAPHGVPGSHMGGMVVLTGRAKDTIVLLSGKNVEPQPIEDAVCASPLLKQAMLLGQDKRELGLLLFPDLDALEATLAQQAASPPASLTAQAAATGGPPHVASSSTSGGVEGAEDLALYPHVAAASMAQLEGLLLPVVQQLNSARHDYVPEQHIAHVAVVVHGAGLNAEDGTLTRTMKLRRAQVCDKYATEARALLGRLR